MHYDIWSVSVQKIDFGYGSANSKSWGYEPPQKENKV